MSDLISRSVLLKALTEYENELQKDMREAIATEDEYMQFAIKNQNTAICRIKRNIINMPTAYEVDKIIKELEVIKDGYEHSCLDNAYERGVEAGAKWIKKKAIEIVKQGGVSDDVCEWEAIGANDNWSTSCDKNSTHNVFGVAWFKRCPYCGRKLKIVGE